MTRLGFGVCTTPSSAYCRLGRRPLVPVAQTRRRHGACGLPSGAARVGVGETRDGCGRRLAVLAAPDPLWRKAQAAHRNDTRMYQIAWQTPVLGGRLGAPHAVEEPMMFGNLDANGAKYRRGSSESGSGSGGVFPDVSEGLGGVRPNGRPESSRTSELAGLRCHPASDDGSGPDILDPGRSVVGHPSGVGLAPVRRHPAGSRRSCPGSRISSATWLRVGVLRCCRGGTDGFDPLAAAQTRLSHQEGLAKSTLTDRTTVRCPPRMRHNAQFGAFGARPPTARTRRRPLSCPRSATPCSAP